MNVAQRIHLSFVIAAALPLLLLALTAYQSVSSRLEQVALAEARQLAKSMGMDVFERLQFLTDQLTLVTRHDGGGALTDDLLDDIDLGERVVGLFQVLPDATLSGPYLPMVVDRAEIVAAASGTDGAKPQLLAAGPPAQRRLYLLVPDTAHDHHAFLGAELRLEHLWDTAGVAARPERVCVLDMHAQPIYCNHAVYTSWLANSVGLVAERGRPRAVIGGRGERVLTAAWSLFLKPHYQFERWTVLVGVDESQAFAAIRHFDRLFGGVALVALILGFLFGRRLIRRNLDPLRRLQQATGRVASGDFAQRVELHSGDEFEELGNAFNGMAARIGEQFDELDMLAKLDRALQLAQTFEAAVAATAGSLDQLLGSGRCAVVCLERWQTPARMWCRGFTARAVETCPPTAGHFPHGPYDAQLQHRLGADAGEVLAVVPVVDGALVAAGIVLRSPDDSQRAKVERIADVLAIALNNLALDHQLYHQANHDWLTGLANRTRLEARFNEWLGAAEPAVIGMLQIGLDRFKQVNDSIGHAAGDQLLGKVARRLAAMFTDDAVLSRFTGDQFVLMIRATDDFEVLKRLDSGARKINAELDRPIAIGPRDVRLSATMGAALCPRDAATFDGMLQCLDAASYVAKSSRRGGLLMFAAGMRNRLAGRMDIEQALKGALANNEIVLHYQPVVDAVTGRVRSAEALMRWQRPGVGLVMPGGFIDVAEQSELIVDFGDWAIAEACRQMHAWQAVGLKLDTLNVNVSSMQLVGDRLVHCVRDALHATGLEPHRLTLEVTETAMIDSFSRTVERIRQLRELGVRIMIDDFGTGYASLKYLKLLPIDGLKIDRLFVKDLPGSAADEAIVTAVVSLAGASAFKLVAEGVETAQQADLLRDSGVPLLQGFRFAKALPAAEFEAFVGAREIAATAVDEAI